MYNKVIRASPVKFPAYYPVTSEYEYVNHIMFGGTMEDGYINPYYDMVRGYNDYSRSMVLALFELTQDLSFITEGLSFSGLGNTKRESFFYLSRSSHQFFYEPYGYVKNR